MNDASSFMLCPPYESWGGQILESEMLLKIKDLFFAKNAKIFFLAVFLNFWAVFFQKLTGFKTLKMHFMSKSCFMHTVPYLRSFYGHAVKDRPSGCLSGMSEQCKLVPQTSEFMPLVIPSAVHDFHSQIKSPSPQISMSDSISRFSTDGSASTGQVQGYVLK